MVLDLFTYYFSYVIQVTPLGMCLTPGFPWLQKSKGCERHHNKSFKHFNVYESAWYVSDVIPRFPWLQSNSASRSVIHQSLLSQYSLVGKCSVSVVSSGNLNQHHQMNGIQQIELKLSVLSVTDKLHQCFICE